MFFVLKKGMNANLVVKKIQIVMLIAATKYAKNLKFKFNKIEKGINKKIPLKVNIVLKTKPVFMFNSKLFFLFLNLKKDEYRGYMNILKIIIFKNIDMVLYGKIKNNRCEKINMIEIIKLLKNNLKLSFLI